MALALWLLACIPQKSYALAGEKVLQFPKNHSVGMIKFPGSKLAPTPAKGTIKAPVQTHLQLECNYESTNDLSFLEKLPPDSLFKLSLRKLEVKDEQLKHVAHLTGLEELDLEDSDITDKGLENLCALKKLRTLRLKSTLVTNKGLAILPCFTNLEDISLSSNRLGDQDLEHLARLKKLVKLDIGRTGITDKGVLTLSKFKQLTRFDLMFNNKVTDKGMSYLVGMKNLYELYIANTGVTKESVKYFKQMPNVHHIMYSRNNFHGEGGVALKTALPKVQLEEYMTHRDMPLELFAPLH